MMKLYTNLVLRYPRQLILLFALLSLVAIFFAVKVRKDGSLDKLLPDSSQTLAERDRIDELFKVKEAVVVGLRFETSIFDANILQFLAKVSEKIVDESDTWGIRSLRSLTSIDDLILLDNDELQSIGLYQYYLQQRDLLGSEVAIEMLQTQVTNNPILQNLIVSKDHRSTFLRIEPNFDNSRGELGVALHNFLLQVFSQEAQHSGVKLERVDISGVPIITSTIATYMSRDLIRLIAGAMLLLSILLWLYFRNLRGIVLPLLEVLVSLLWTFALMGILGQDLSLISITLPVILMAVGIADDLYFLIEFDHNWTKCGNKRQAVLKSMERLFWPHIITSLTTAIGFLSFASSPLASVRQFAFFAAFGIAVTLLFSLLVVPSLLLILPLSSARLNTAQPNWLSQRLERVVQLCQGSKAKWLALLLLTLLLGLAFTELQVRFSGIELFRKNAPLRIADRNLNRNFGGTAVLYAHFSTNKDALMKQAQFLQLLEKLQQQLQTDPGVGYTVSLSDYIKRINQVFNQENRLPNNDDTIEQLLFLYEILDITLLEQVATPSFNDLNIPILIRENRSDSFKRIRSLIEDFVEREIKPKFGDDIQVKFSGQGDFAIEIIDNVLRSQKIGIPLIVASMLLLLMLIFRSLRAALMAVMPIIAALVFLFGMQALLRVPINMVTGLLSGIVAGLGIDYCIHLLSQLEVWRRQNKNCNAEESRQEFNNILSLVGRAVLLNALSLSLGFLVLIASSFAAIQQLGLMLTVCMSGTAVIVLIFIPRFYSDNKLTLNKDSKS